MLTAIRASLIAVSLFVGTGISKAASADAQTPIWRVINSSGEFSIDKGGGQPTASSGNADMLEPGDTIRTGESGRLLLTHGAASILVSGNTTILVPRPSMDGSAPAIIQVAGSAEYQLAEGDLTQFAVKAPHLAITAGRANFRVVVEKDSAHVDALAGDVEVSDLISGQTARITTGQAATAWAHTSQGLSLSGQGRLAPIRQSVRSHPPAMPSSAAVIGQGQAPVVTPEEPKPYSAYDNGGRSHKEIGIRDGATSAHGAKLAAETAHAPEKTQLGNGKQQKQADTRTVTAQGMQQKVGTVTASSRSDEAVAAALKTPASEIVASRPADRAPSPPAEAAPAQTGEQKKSLVASSLSPMTRSARDAAKSGGILTNKSSDAENLDAYATKAAIAATLANNSTAARFDGHATRAALAKILGVHVQAEQVAQPTASISNSNHRLFEYFNHNQKLITWGLPLGIGALATLIVALFRPRQERRAQDFDYNY